MKKGIAMRRIFLLAILIAAAVLAFWACELLGVSIEQRVEQFVSDLNTSRESAYENFHPTATEDYDAIKPAATWLTWFDPTPPDYSITDLDTSDSRNVTAEISGPVTFLGPRTITFRMLKDGSDWFIEEMDLEDEIDNPIVK